MNIKTRKKASDIYSESSFVFVTKAPFEQVFPQIEDLEVTIEESLYGSKKQVRRYGKQDIEAYCDCSNPLCYGGGIPISGILHRMVQNKETHFEGTELCIGNEGSAKGRRIYRKCMHLFKYEVNIKYKSTV